MTVYAKWTYQVTFDAGTGGTFANGETTITASCLAGATVGLPSPEPTKASHLFGGWFTEPNGNGTPFTASTPVNENTTVYAKWIREEEAVTVTFDADGGTPGTSTVSCEHGESVVLPSPDPTHTYHTFGGWYTEPNGNGTPFTAETQVTANMTAYAKWTPYLQVTFDANPGTPAISSVLYPPGARVNLPSEPTYPEHTFGGWYTEPNGNGTPFTATMPVTEDMTVYAKWTPYLQVTFDANGGTFANGETTITASCPAGSTVVTVVPPRNPTRAGYAIDGWYTAPNGGGDRITETTLVTEDMTVYANWKPYLQVTFNTDGGEPITMTMTCLSGESAALPGNPTKAGYAFDGWYTAVNGGGTPFTASTPVNENTTVYAKWIRVEDALTVTFDAAGGTPGTSTVTCAHGESVALPSPDPTHTYHTFGGWYTERNGGGTQFTATTPVTADMRVYAKWTPYPVVTFDADGGTPATSTVLYPAGATVVLPPNPTKADYIFRGWYTAQNGNGTEFTASTPVTADITVYAKWTYPQVTFDADGGTFANGETTSTASCPAGARVTLPSDPTRASYYFGGWYPEQNGGGAQFTASTLVTEDITVYARWGDNPHTIFDADGGMFENNGWPVEIYNWWTTAGFDVYIYDTPDPTRTGYVFGGWFTEPNGGGTQVTGVITPTDSITMYAKWTSYFHVTFDADGGIFEYIQGIPATVTVSCPAGSTVESIVHVPDPWKARHSFGGWYTERNGDGMYYEQSSEPVTEDITVYANWYAMP
jgi:uncharacterized repeat protein (TIGR02543 family)